MFKFKTILFILPALLLVFSCKKITQKKVNAEDSAIELAIVENFYVELKSLCDEAVQGMSQFQTYSSSCDTIYFDTLTTNKKVTVDFGPANCLGQDGRNRRGKLDVYFTGSYFDPNSTVNISTVNYFVNDYQLIGIVQVKNNGNNTCSYLINAQVVKPNGSGTITWTSTMLRTQTAGFDTPKDITDDVFEFSSAGAGTGKTASGADFSADIIDKLIKSVNCKWIASGKVELKTGDQTTSFDYGDGTCDDQADYTRKSKTIKVTLK